MPLVRPASHAGSWYIGSGSRLNAQLDKFLASTAFDQSTIGARVIIGPHAGYTYSGSTLAEAYKSWDTSKVKRIFILGPSHYVYFKNYVLTTKFDYYETPMGNLPVDTEIIDQLTLNESSSKIIRKMSFENDEEEHSFELHAPYIYKMAKDLPQGIPKIIPIMVCSLDDSTELKIAKILSKYISDEETSFIISSDFCHWGSRFDYTIYSPTKSLKNLKELSTRNYLSYLEPSIPIYKSIEFLDREAMKVLSKGAYNDWKQYIKLTGNTICGQKPIAIILKAIENYKSANKISLNSKGPLFNFLGYRQSSHVRSFSDSSVSYASAYAII
ncbi:Mho1p [Ascoidea rubescens DSM 1968]|uniref:UPF0103-domain-containing protein n=1 Tax=Ascoidea rubescens DSM 1968 TaxID=1344418 RepID=A0A1D2VLF6_9ASCO|nr:UPF0103-domain-containing protein [Ascoidea rubescens DSM 1968]ODV62439.1 UPF0103-domain-containing protein [Ascoidea rubescens DSM 1968]